MIPFALRASQYSALAAMRSGAYLPACRGPYASSPRDLAYGARQVHVIVRKFTTDQCVVEWTFMSKSTLEAALSDAIYDQGSEYERSYKVQMREMVPSSPSLRILDVGCGTGLNTCHFVKLGHKVTGF